MHSSQEFICLSSFEWECFYSTILRLKQVKVPYKIMDISDACTPGFDLSVPKRYLEPVKALFWNSLSDEEFYDLVNQQVENGCVQVLYL